jgi:hypothetical protein
MKTQRALILPALLVTLVAAGSDLRAQFAPPGPDSAGATQAPPGAVISGPPRAAPGQMPLGIRSALGMPAPENYGAVPLGAGGGPPMGSMFPATQFAAQMGPAPMGPGGYGIAPAGYETGGGGYDMSGMGGGGYGAPMMGCPHCGGAGCPFCMGDGLGGDYGEEQGFDLLRKLGPYGAGGWCSPRWYDIYGEFLYLTREDVSRTVDFTSDGPAGLGDPFIVLSTDNLDFDERPGFRFVAALQFGASGNIEFNYLGTLNWAKSASVTSPTDDLYSVFSDFGNDPPPQAGPPIVRGGFTDTDSADFHSIEYSSNLDSLELGYRRRWMAPNCRIQGSWIAGVRYLRLEEQFLHKTRVDYPDPNGGGAPDITGFLDYEVGTANSMTGFQVGGDAWATLFPGIQLGSDFKMGIYGNRADQVTTINAQSLASTIVESDSVDEVAFLAEANLIGTWRLSQNLTLRGGYTAIYVDGVALAPENFNSGAPFVGGDRTVFINANGDLLLHGFTGGVEWMW